MYEWQTIIGHDKTITGTAAAITIVEIGITAGTMAGIESNIEIVTGTITIITIITIITTTTATAAGTEIETTITATTITKNVANGLHRTRNGVTNSGTILLW